MAIEVAADAGSETVIVQTQDTKPVGNAAFLKWYETEQRTNPEETGTVGRFTTRELYEKYSKLSAITPASYSAKQSGFFKWAKEQGIPVTPPKPGRTGRGGGAAADVDKVLAELNIKRLTEEDENVSEGNDE